MKISRILLLLVLSVAILSCSKDDEDPTPAANLETAKLSFSSSTKVVSAPASMASSQDDYATLANSYVASINGITSYLSLFSPPSGAVKSSSGITAANGRIASTQATYLVYTWSDPNYGSVAYQISEESDKFVFEIFFKQKSGNSWLRYIYSEEKKDRSAGFMKIYDLFTGAPTSTVLIDYSWSRSGDILDFVMSVPDEDFKIAISINEKTKAGSVLYYIDGVLWYQIKWDALGNGSWAWYEEDGKTISESGEWKI